MKTAAAYIRVSDDRQDEYSPDSQLKLVRRFAEAHGYDLPEDFIFYDDGISGKSVRRRDAFNDMIAIAKDRSHPIDAILVWKFSRFARNQEESIVYKSLLRRNGVDVISVSEPIVDGPFGSLIERIIEWMDEYYVIRLSGEVKRGLTEKVTRGEPVCAPAFGYSIRDKQYFPNTDADIVREVYESYLGGEGMRAIALRLGNAGVRTKFGNRPDNRWVEYMLRNPVYIGKIRWCTNGKGASARHYDSPDNLVVDGHHTPIIDVPLWDAVQAKLDEQKKRYAKQRNGERRSDWPLKGLFRCSACGATMVRIHGAVESLQCAAYGRGQCKTSHSITTARAEALLAEALHAAVAQREFVFAPTKEAADGPEAIARQLDEEHRRLDRAREAYRNGVDTLEEYAETKAKITAKLAELERLLREAEQAPPFDADAYAARVAEALRVFTDSEASGSEKNAALKAIIDRVTFRRDICAVEVFFREE